MTGVIGPAVEVLPDFSRCHMLLGLREVAEHRVPVVHHFLDFEPDLQIFLLHDSSLSPAIAGHTDARVTDYGLRKRGRNPIALLERDRASLRYSAARPA